MVTIDEATAAVKPAQKPAKKTKGKVGRPPKAVVTPGTTTKKVKDETKNKAPNFQPDEDELIAQAWVSATENPIVGNGQKSATFWNDVHSRYCLLQEKSLSADTTNVERSWNQIKGRFLRHIQPGVYAFNRYYKKAKEIVPSGTPDIEEEIMKRAMEEYAMDEATSFKFPLCIPILHTIPKFFDPFTEEEGDEEGNEERPSVMGCNLNRPLGSKAAKERKKEMADTHANVEGMRKDFTKLVDSTLRKEEFEELIGLAKYYRSIGDMEAARAREGKGCFKGKGFKGSDVN